MPQETVELGIYVFGAAGCIWLFVDGLRKGRTSLHGLKGDRLMSPQIYGGLMLLWAGAAVLLTHEGWTYGRELWASGYFAGLLR